MATESTYRLLNATNKLAMEWVLGASSNTVVISIYDMNDNGTDVSAATMTNETGALFSYDWVPTEEHTYRIDYHNQTLDSHVFEIATVTDSVVL